MKRTINTIILAILVLFTSCQHDEKIFLSQEPDVPEGYVNIRFKVDQTDMAKVDVRSVDPDGQDISTMTLFCFNAYGLFLASVHDVTLIPGQADAAGHYTSGTYTANIPEETSIIHFIANQNSNLYDDEDFVNETEAQVLADMEGASGMMIYWARFAKSSTGGDIQTQLANLNDKKGIELIRNQAKVTIANWSAEFDNGGTFTVTGYVTTNIHAFGTVAPFCSEHGFAIYNWPSDHVSVTLPDNKAMMSDITDINTKSEDYIFEHENTLDNPVSVIIKGRHNGQEKDLYYRAMIMNDQGEMIPILRNHHYVLNIVGSLSYGQETFEAALNGPATNNVWVSVDSWVKEVADRDYKLTLEETSKVFHADKEGTAYAFTYTLALQENSDVTDLTAPEVSWLDGNNVARHEFVHTFDPATGRGTISITLLEDNPDTPSQNGTLMIRKGRLYRTIDISMISTQQFTPSWVAAQVYGGTTGEFVTLKFTIPETCPESLFPFPVMISVNDLDVRSSSGMTLPVRLADEASWYGEPNDIGYKYEYMVDEPGVHRLYFHSILPHGDNETELITVEANFFEKLEKRVSFVNHELAITMDGLQIADKVEGFADDEIVKYLLVPQKINAPVMFSMQMKNLKDDTNINATETDEFMLYSKTLDYCVEADMGLFNGITAYDCTFYPVDETYWSTSTNGRVMMFMPNNPTKTDTEVGRYKIYMKTNRPKSEDVVRIASNVSGSLSAHPDKSGQSYDGKSYRSTIFELANHRPFRFAAQVDGQGSYQPLSSLDAEKVSELSWNYGAPGAARKISFDITSFKGTDGTSVDPFGTEFKVYIDAPMLEIDEDNRGTLSDTKFYEESEGRFVYVVNADRDNERSNNGEEVKLQDMSKVDQTGERKVLPFKTKAVTNSGIITISADENVVIYHSKTFKVSNNPISGTIKFRESESDTASDVPANAFVAFIRTQTNTRIGAINVTTTGNYELNLRAEYAFNWTDDVILNYKVGTTVYEYKTRLSELAASSDVILTKLVQ